MNTCNTVMAFLTAMTMSIEDSSAQLPWMNKNPQSTYLVISDNVGFSPTEEEQLLIRKAAYDMIQKEIKETKSGDRNRTIHVLLTTHSTNVVFNGSGKQLEKEGGRIATAISTFKARCNDLARTYSNIEDDINANGYRRVRIVHIGKFVHSPAPCKNGQSVTVPQQIPDELALGRIMKSVKYVDFTALAVHPDQYAPLNSYFKAHRLLGKKRADISIKRIDETRTYIGFTAAASKVNAGPATGGN